MVDDNAESRHGPNSADSPADTFGPASRLDASDKSSLGPYGNDRPLERARPTTVSEKDIGPPVQQGEQMTDTDTNRSIVETMSPTREFLFVAVITLAQFMTQASLGQTIAILHVIGAHYGITNNGLLSWLIAGYSLTIGSFILVSGRLGDLFGYKRMLMIGFTWFAISSVVAGLATYSNHVLFIFARVFQGIGPSICLPNALALLGATYPPGRRKAMVFALFGAAAPGGSITGSLFASLFALSSWPWSYWSFAIALGAVAVVGYLVIPEPPTHVKTPISVRETLIRCDALGGLVGVTSLVLVNFAWNQAGIVGWSPAYVKVCLVLGIVLVPVFFYIETSVSSSPLLPFEALSSDVAFVLGCVACGWATFGIWFFYIWQLPEVLRHASPLLTTAFICPVAVSGTLAAIATGYLLGRLHPSIVMLIAMLSFLAGVVLVATCPVDQIYWGQLFFAALITPIGMDCSFPAATLILSNAVEKKHQGIAASLVNTVVNYSISLSLGFAGTIEMNVNRGGTTPVDILHGYRGALYFGVGLSSLGVAISVAFVIKTFSGGTKQDGPIDMAG